MSDEVKLPKSEETIPVHDEPANSFESACGAGSFFTPDGLLGKIVKKKTVVSLPGLYMARVEHLGIVYGVHVREDDHGGFSGSIFMDGEKVGCVWTVFGKEKCRHMTMKALNGLMHHRERRLRQTIRKMNSVLSNPPFEQGEQA